MPPQPLDISFTLIFSPTDTAEEVAEQIGKLRILIDAAKAIGVPIKVIGSKVQNDRATQRECFDALRKQNTETINNLTTWCSILGISYSMLSKIFTGHQPVSLATFEAIKLAVADGRVHCDEGTLARIQNLVEQ